MGSFICKTCGKPWPLGLWDKKDEMRECDSCRDNKTIASLRAQLKEKEREIEEQSQRAEMAEKDNRLLRENMTESTTLSPSQVCAKYHVQNCHACERADCGDNMTPGIVALRAKLEEAREEIETLKGEWLSPEEAGRLIDDLGALFGENERMRVDGDGSEEHPFTRQFIGKCFKRHDSLLSFGVCERDDGFELTVDAVDGVRHNYAIMPDGSICDLDKLANTKAQPQTGGVDNGGDLQQALDDLRTESCPAKEGPSCE